MADIYWKGSAKKVAQVQTYTFGGTWEADDVIRCSFSNGKSVDVTAGSTTTNTVVDNLVTAWNALSATDYPEFAELTASRSSSNFVLTSDTAGVPFTVTLTPLEANLGAADAQTIEGAGTATTGTTATANSGPNDWSVAANWSGGAVPVNSDNVRIENSNVDILYGLAQSSVTLATLYVGASFTGKIGLPRWTGTYFEYRNQFLAIGATTVTIGRGSGAGSGRIKLDAGSVQTAVSVYGSGSRLETDVPALLWKGTHASNAVEVLKGDVGVALFSGETSTIASLLVAHEGNPTGDATLWAGSGLTLTTLNMGGGNVALEAGLTTITKTSGTLTLRAGNVTTVNHYGGFLAYTGTGTITTYNGTEGSEINFTQDLSGRTITTTNLFKGARFVDSFATVTLTNGIVVTRCRLEDVFIDVGFNRTITVA